MVKVQLVVLVVVENQGLLVARDQLDLQVKLVLPVERAPKEVVANQGEWGQKAVLENLALLDQQEAGVQQEKWDPLELREY